MADEEKEIIELENRFPAASGSAFSAARKQALDSGRSVLEAEDGVIYEIFPDGTRKLVKKIEPPIEVTAGMMLRIG